MAQVRLKINENHVPNVLSVVTGLNVASGHDGHPQDDRPRLTSITITRESDKMTDLWDWAAQPWAEAYKTGTIEFLDPQKQDKVIRTIKWEDGFLTGYREAVPDTQNEKSSPMTETVEIAARIVDFDGMKLEAYQSS